MSILGKLSWSAIPFDQPIIMAATAFMALGIGSILALIGMIVWKLVLPLRRVPTDVQLARFSSKLGGAS